MRHDDIDLGLRRLHGPPLGHAAAEDALPGAPCTGKILRPSARRLLRAWQEDGHIRQHGLTIAQRRRIPSQLLRCRRRQKKRPADCWCQRAIPFNGPSRVERGRGWITA